MVLRLQDLQIFKIYKKNKGFAPAKAPKMSSPENQVLGPETILIENLVLGGSEPLGRHSFASQGPFGWGPAVRRTAPNIANTQGK